MRAGEAKEVAKEVAARAAARVAETAVARAAAMEVVAMVEDSEAVARVVD